MAAATAAPNSIQGCVHGSARRPAVRSAPLLAAASSKGLPPPPKIFRLLAFDDDCEEDVDVERDVVDVEVVAPGAPLGREAVATVGDGGAAFPLPFLPLLEATVLVF